MKLNDTHASAEPAIRRARLADVDGIRALGREFCRLSNPHDSSQQAAQEYVDAHFERMWDADYLRHIIRDEAAALIVAACGERIVAMAMAAAKPGDPRVAGLSRLCVLPAYRESALTPRLLWLCEECLPPTVESVDTCVPQDDAAQLSLYERQGFARRRVLELNNGIVANTFIELAKPLARKRLSPLAARSTAARPDAGLN